jgi:hypothetical protein
VTALSPTRLQDGASCAGAHTCTKAVLTCFASVIWLKGALHGASYGASSFGERGLWVIPVPAARDEQPPQANGARDRRHTYPPPENRRCSIF